MCEQGFGTPVKTLRPAPRFGCFHTDGAVNMCEQGFSTPVKTLRPAPRFGCFHTDGAVNMCEQGFGTLSYRRCRKAIQAKALKLPKKQACIL